MTPGGAAAWLEGRAQTLRQRGAIEQVALRELRPSQGDPVWLLHIALTTATSEWEQPIGALVQDLRKLGMQPTICIDERVREAPVATREPVTNPLTR